jgi:hypothetical protein
VDVEGDAAHRFDVVARATAIHDMQIIDVQLWWTAGSPR